MSDIATRLAGPQACALAAATVYTVPAATTTIIRNIHAVNTGAVPATFNLSIGADAAAARLFSAHVIPAGQVLDWAGFIVVTAAEILQAFASAVAVTLTITGVEVT